MAGKEARCWLGSSSRSPLFAAPQVERNTPVKLCQMEPFAALGGGPSSALRPTQLSSRPTQLIWWSVHLLRRVFWGRNRGRSFVTRTGSLRRGWFIVPPLRAGPQSSPSSPPDKRAKNSSARKSAVSQTDVATSRLHMQPPSPPPPRLPASVAEQMRQNRPPARSHISSSLTPQRHMSLTDRPSVCFPLRDEVHFLCSLCFRPQIKKRDLPFKKRRVYIVWVLWGKAQSRHTVGGL